MQRLSHLAPVLVGILGLTWPASAQPPPDAAVTPACHSHADLAEMLHQKFAEQPSAIGLQANGHLVEVFVSNDGASWTNQSSDPTVSATTSTNTATTTTILLRKIGATSPFETVTWVLDNRSPSAPSWCRVFER